MQWLGCLRQATTRGGPRGDRRPPELRLQREAGGELSQKPPSRPLAGYGLPTAGRARACANCRLPYWQGQALLEQLAVRGLLCLRSAELSASALWLRLAAA